MTPHSNINSEIDLLIEVLKGMRKQLESVTKRFDNAVKNDSKLKEYIDVSSQSFND